jgi:hypothetical protein
MNKKDFSIGDKVTVVELGKTVMRGVVLSIDNGVVCVAESSACKGHMCYAKNCYHGHNVKVEITGEELPERLRMEEVFVYFEHIEMGKGGVVLLPAPIARAIKEWQEENK